jgi:2-oxoglutarate ferredoxin oxidoreductase subunit beta
VVQLGNGVTEQDLVVHDEAGPIGYLAMLAELQPPEFPMPIGVIRRVGAPTFDAGMRDQIEEVTRKKGQGDLLAALTRGSTWTIE